MTWVVRTLIQYAGERTRSRVAVEAIGTAETSDSQRYGAFIPA